MSVLPLLVLACWAPDRDPQWNAPPDDDEPASTPSAPPPQTPPPPFSAWTSRGPTSIVGPGGETLALLERAGVRMEVSRVLPVRMLLRCTGCPGEAAGVEGWLQNEALWWPGAAPLPPDHPLTEATRLRARWTQGEELPTGLPPEVDADALCGLLDGGYEGGAGGVPARFAVGPASLVLAWDGQRWSPPKLEGRPLPSPGACR